MLRIGVLSWLKAVFLSENCSIVVLPRIRAAPTHHQQSTAQAAADQVEETGALPAEA